MADQLHYCLDLETVAQCGVKSMMDYSQSPLAAIFTLDELTGRFDILQSQGVDPEVLHEVNRALVDNRFVEVAFENGHVSTREETGCDRPIEGMLKNVLRDRGFSDLVFVPLLFQEKSVGVIMLLFKEGFAYSTHTHEGLFSMGKAIALAMATARHRAMATAEIKDRERAEREKEALQRQLVQSQKMEAIGTLAGGIAHDFNNVLSAIVGYAEISLEDAPKDSDLEDNLTQLLKAGCRARDLVRQILAFSRKSGYEPRPVTLKVILAECITFLRASLPSTIEIRQGLDSESTVMADPIQIHQVVMNLSSNAAHAMREKGGVLDIELVDVELDPDFATKYPGAVPGRFVRLSVGDTGCGMPQRIVDRIFDPFFTTKEKGEGTGMGLSVVHGIVKRHHGVVTVSTDVNQGTTFNIFLPTIESDVISDMDKEQGLPSGTERILFVDDEDFQVDLGKQILERLGYKVVTEIDSPKALELFRASPHAFDLVITDMTMPNLTGIDLARKLLAIRPGIAIIITTGYSEELSPEKAEVLGIKALAMKPLLIRDIANKVREVLDRGQA
ncbi:MAG: ATP-binding protein [Thermodesulfobacteriota bacterium]|nr:ATP-binding protein [Thermodesulfobacteriota bacterium]